MYSIEFVIIGEKEGMLQTILVMRFLEMLCLKEIISYV